jgi:ABC-type uncharacterized transport system auxiliary subunit
MRLLASLSFGLAAFLGGCVNVLPQPETPSALIALPPERAEAPRDPLRADVAIYPPDSSRAFAGVNMAVRNDQEMVYLADVRWADAPPRLLQGAVVDALSGAAGDGRAAPAQLGANVDYDVRWRIVDLSAGRDTSPVKVEVEVSLLDSRSRRMIAQDTYRAEGSPASRSPRDRAAALAVAAQSVANQVAAFVARSAEPKAPLATAATPPAN